MANFIGLVYATLKGEGIDTANLEVENAIQKYLELKGKDTATPNEQKRMDELGIHNNKQEHKMPKVAKEFYKEYFSEYKPQYVNINQIVKDNNLKKDNGTLERRQQIWGKSYDDYKIDIDQYDKDIKHPILITKINGKYKIEDGMHRLIALQNGGYKNVELLVKDLDK